MTLARVNSFEVKHRRDTGHQQEWAIKHKQQCRTGVVAAQQVDVRTELLVACYGNSPAGKAWSFSLVWY
jgi:hypothetical protein